MPRQTDNRHNVAFPGEGEPRSGLSVLVREGFVVGHYDPMKVPAWVAVPQATYKVVGWFDGDGLFHARGYVVRQEDRLRGDPAHHLEPIDEIEAATGLDFFPELPGDREDQIETAAQTDPWGGGTDPGDWDVGGGGQVIIASLLPNPAGDESVNEAVTVRNVGSAAVSLSGWRLRDAANRTRTLFGTLRPGDERTCTRDGQSMALNNSGDDVVLLDGSGSVMDRVSYGSAQEGAVLQASDLR